jgi:hypothetical protein
MPTIEPIRDGKRVVIVGPAIRSVSEDPFTVRSTGALPSTKIPILHG